jgi:hypothetical protein
MQVQQAQVQQVQVQQAQVQQMSNMDIYTINKHSFVEMECSICYKPINKYYAQCSAPCNKRFHTSCMEKMVQQTEIAAYEEEQEAEHKCCYCRRSFDINKYGLLDVVRQLMCLQRGGYHVNEALRHIKKQLQNGENDDDGEAYNVYYVERVHYQKRPKQTKRMPFQKRITKQPRIKQNIGGRRK